MHGTSNPRLGSEAATPIARRFAMIPVLWLVAVGAVAAVSTAGASEVDFTEMSLEDLVNLEIVSVSKKPELLNDASAAIAVITSEDIRRSGATSIPEALRLVPGVQVARIDANKWAVTARGFNNRFANKLLVLIDGRSIYTPLFSGVFWLAGTVTLESVDRIEVIRGPGATMWGANAVNGVINIITKDADANPGLMALVAVGTEERARTAFVYGGHANESTGYRLSGSYVKHDNYVNLAGDIGSDQFENLHLEGRLDWSSSPSDEITMSASYANEESRAEYLVPLLSEPYQASAAVDSRNWIASGQVAWHHKWSDFARSELIASYAGSRITDEVLLNEKRQTADVEIRQFLELGQHHAFILGAGYRYSHDEIWDGVVGFDPGSLDADLFNAFIQDDIAILPDRLRVTVGTKVEYNDYTGTEVQPSFRFLWNLHPNQRIWGAISRAVQTPSRYEDGVNIFHSTIPPGTGDNRSPFPVAVYAVGNPDLAAEQLLAHELGYRLQATSNTSIDLAGFYNKYDRLRVVRSGEPVLHLETAEPFVEQPYYLSSGSNGETWGAELAVELAPSNHWRLRSAYSYLDGEVRFEEGATSISGDGSILRSPKHQLSLRSSHDLSQAWQVDLWLKYTDAIYDIEIDPVWNLDLSLGWRLHPNLMMSFVGQGLLEAEQTEFQTVFLRTTQTAIQRGFYGKLTWRF